MLRSWISIVVVLILQICGYLIFAKGFFPQKIVQPGHAEYSQPDQPQPQFDKLVVMVVDAMRADFTYSTKSSMKFVHELISKGHALPFTGHSSPPTVTLPRLKGLTTGGTPNFLDAILNIAEDDDSNTLNDQDSWVYQFKKRGKKIHMFGDDTWIKLFPESFDKTDGTASFFVSDFTEVDNNVTRHVQPEMKNQTWDVLILHYLGLDHIGHKGGPDSPFMTKKQAEMDGIVKQVYDHLDDKTLFVLLGDHGMNEVGNHGGSSAGETSPSLTFIAPKLRNLGVGNNAPVPVSEDYTYYNKVHQIDLVPTISALFGFPIPKNSLGVMLKEFLPFWGPTDQKTILQENLNHMNQILESSHESVELKNVTTHEHVFKYLRNVQEKLAKASTNYKTDDMVIGFSILAGAGVYSLVVFWLLRSISFELKAVITGACALYACIMFGSSWVEEEHQFWYWASTGWVAWCYLLSARKQFKAGVTWIICLTVIRIIRGWNQTGQKYAGAVDIAKTAEQPEYCHILWFFIVLYYGQLGERLWRGCFADINSMAGFLFSFITVVSSFVFKLNMASVNDEPLPSLITKMVPPVDTETGNAQLITLARLSFATIAVGAMYMVSRLIPGQSKDKQPLTHLSYILEVLLANQTRTRNIPIFLLFYLLRYYVRNSAHDIASTTIFILILQHVSFFALGNSNSLATVDLSNAYNGVGAYNLNIVGVLTFVSNWVGPLYWSFAGVSILLESRGLRSYKREEILTTRLIITLLFFSAASAGVMCACLCMKHHLFIWTVFSPKLLFAAVWTLLHHGLVDFIITCILALI